MNQEAADNNNDKQAPAEGEGAPSDKEATPETEADAPKEPSANFAVKDDALGNKRLRKQV